jgi:alpha-1,6-mannosyltransferase
MPRALPLIAAGGSAYLAALITLAASETRLGTPLFFACAGVAVAIYAAVLALIWRPPGNDRRAFTAAVLFAIAFRIVLAVPPVNSDNDMIRYVWDGRLQTLGINPYAVRPADPEVAFTHTDETRDMPSARARTPYPPAAQIFFRFVVSLHDSSRAMKLALIACDLLTMLVLWRWLLVTGRSPWLTLAYGWNPLVILEVAHSGHIDALGALWLLTSAFWLARGRTSLATVAYVLAVATKLLPIVLAPLFWRRISVRDTLIGIALFVLLYLPYASGADVLFGVQNVVQHIRFNGPLFRSIAWLASPEVAANVAVGLGVLVAAWCRWKLRVDAPAAWAWPMAVSMLFAPVIYPWYLLYLTPFLLLPTTLPLIAWGCSVLLTYTVWEIAVAGGRWVVPGPILVAEYGIAMAAAAFLLWWIRRQGMPAPAGSGGRTRATEGT